MTIVSTLAALAFLVLGAEAPHPITQSGRGAYEASLTPFRDGFATAVEPSAAELGTRVAQPAVATEQITNPRGIA